jgi:hypothetical protein
MKISNEDYYQVLPVDVEFGPTEIADKLFPHLSRSGGNGAYSNKAAAAVSRKLRKLKGVRELKYLKFYFPVEMKPMEKSK